METDESGVVEFVSCFVCKHVEYFVTSLEKVEAHDDEDIFEKVSFADVVLEDETTTFCTGRGLVVRWRFRAFKSLSSRSLALDTETTI